MYMLDTDTVSFFMKDNPKSVRKNVEKHSSKELCISAITCAELMFGLRRNYSKQLDLWLHEALGNFKIIDFDDNSAAIYGDIRSALEKSGELLDNMDMLIASSALASGAVLVSHNIKHFSRIKGLKLEDWV